MSHETAGISYFPIGVCRSLTYAPFLEELKVPVNAPFEVGPILEKFFQNKRTELDGIEIIPIIGFHNTCKELEKDKVFLDNLIALVYGKRAQFWFFAKERCLHSMYRLHQQYFPPEELYFHTVTPHDSVFTVGKSTKRHKETLTLSRITPETIIGLS